MLIRTEALLERGSNHKFMEPYLSSRLGLGTMNNPTTVVLEDQMDTQSQECEHYLYIILPGQKILTKFLVMKDLLCPLILGIEWFN